MSTENSNLSNFDSSTVPSGDSLTIGLVVSKWNEKITESLFNGAYTTLTEFGVKANNIKNVCRVSVHIIVFIPPRKV